MDYISKLTSHKKFSNKDIKDFCFDQKKYLQLDDFVEHFEFDYLNYGTSIYCKKLKTIVFDDKFDSYYKYRLKYHGLNNKLFCNYNDLYNLFIINIVYHELWHAKQNKILLNTPDSDYSKLINHSDKLCNKKELYVKYHDRFLIEYDAIINSINLTFNYIKNLDFNNRSLYILNTHFSNQILSSYGLYSQETKKYNSPINFINYLLDNTNTKKQELEELKTCVINYTKLKTNNINDLFNGLEIEKNLINYIKSLSNGSIKSSNIIEDIKKYYKSRN